MRSGGGESSQAIAPRRVLEMLGLAARAGALVTGTDAVRRAVREDRIRRVVLAADAAEGQRQKVVPLLEARAVPFHVLFTRVELGAAAGRAPTSAIGITDMNLARRVGELLSTLVLRRTSDGRVDRSGA